MNSLCLRGWRCVMVAALLAAKFAAAEVPFELTTVQDDIMGVFAVGDIDNDGKNDIVISYGTYPLHWRQYPDLTDYPILSQGKPPYGELHCYDVDGDGDLDIIAPTGSAGANDALNGTVSWYENPLPDVNPTDAGASWTRHDIGSFGCNSHDCKIGDVNGDGKVDVVVKCNQDGSSYFVFIQNDPDSWTRVLLNPPANDAGNFFEGTAVGDIDKDGKDEITDGRIWFHCPDDPVHQSWPAHQINNYPNKYKRAAIADMNEDGRPDIITANSEFGQGPLAWYEAPENPTSANWTEHVITPAADLNDHTLQIGDVDGDGHLDIVTGTTHGPCDDPKLMQIFYNVNGSGESLVKQQWTVRYGVWQGVLGDVGSDGDLDILSSDYEEDTGKHLNAQEWWENKRDPVTRARSPAQHGLPRNPSFSVRSNGADGTVRIVARIANGNMSGMQMTIFDVKGRAVRPITGLLRAGGHAITFVIAANGSYFACINDGQTRIVLPFLIDGMK